jgi:hypothetical protein
MLFLSVLGLSAGLVNIHIAPTNDYRVGGLPPVKVKIYYGVQSLVYTNSVVFSMNTTIDTNTVNVYEPFNCLNMLVTDRIKHTIVGLKAGQTFYYGYSYINSNNVESSMVNNSVCGFVVTNNSDAPFPPTYLRVIAN